LQRVSALCAISILLASSAVAQRPVADQIQARAELATSETMFSMLTALNLCGFDAELANSDPLREQVRKEVSAVLAADSAAEDARQQFCEFRKDKQLPNSGTDLAQYVSLALDLSAPPQIAPVMREADLPPDAANVLGAVPLLQRFYDAAGLHKIWLAHQQEYENDIAQLQPSLQKMIFATDLYLKQPFAGAAGKRFVIFVDPMGAPGQVNARNYGPNYFIVVSPAKGEVPMAPVRHTYLHYVLDPLVANRGTSLRGLDPILEALKTAPIDENYKEDAGMLVIESLIRAVEARQVHGADDNSSEDTESKKEKKAESRGESKSERKALQKADRKSLGSERDAVVDASMTEGFVLTRYFFDQLALFEKSPESIKTAFPNMLHDIPVESVAKQARHMVFKSAAAQEIVQRRQVRASGSLLDDAEAHLAAHDPEGAHRIAEQALKSRTEDAARAMFILARADTLEKNIDEAQLMFEKTLEIAREPRMIAWSHIYLARILDLQCHREAALAQYKAALEAGDPIPDTKSAVDKGMKEAPERCKEEDQQQ